MTNKTLQAASLIAFHDGRGSQEAVFAELKTYRPMDYVPTRTLTGNQTYMLCSMLALNLGRELQMRTRAPERGTLAKRPARWKLATLETLRRTIMQRAGRFLTPQRRLTLAMSANEKTRDRLLELLAALDQTPTVTLSR